MLLALQNVRTGKAHYLVVCKCPSNAIMEGPVLHTQPPYARIPGISVYGMLCVQGRKSRLRKESKFYFLFKSNAYPNLTKTPNMHINIYTYIR